MLEYLLNELEIRKEKRDNLHKEYMLASLEDEVMHNTYFALKDYKNSYKRYLSERKTALVVEIMNLVFLGYVAFNVSTLLVILSICFLVFDGCCLYDFFSALKEKINCKERLDNYNLNGDENLDTLLKKRESVSNNLDKVREEYEMACESVLELEHIIAEPDLVKVLSNQKNRELIKPYLEGLFQEYLEEMSHVNASEVSFDSSMRGNNNIKKYQRTLNQ